MIRAHLSALWHLYARPRLREALGVTALDAPDFARRLDAVEDEVARLAVSEDSRARRLDAVEGMATRLATSESYQAMMGVDTVSRLGALEAREVIDAADLATALREAVEAFDAKHPPPPGVGPYGVSCCPSHNDLFAALDRAAVIRRERVETARDAGRGS